MTKSRKTSGPDTADALPENAAGAEAIEKSPIDITDAAQVKDDAAKATENDKDNKVIYVGASLPGIKSNTVIKGKIPEKLNVPFVKDLVIPINEFTAFLKKRAQTNSREAYCYKKSVEYAKTLSE